MATITNARIVLDDTGKEILADPHGNNVAILCPACAERPLLLVARAGMRGSTHDRPSRCHCGARAWITSPLIGEAHEVRIAFEPAAVALGRARGDHLARMPER